MVVIGSCVSDMVRAASLFSSPFCAGCAKRDVVVVDGERYSARLANTIECKKGRRSDAQYCYCAGIRRGKKSWKDRRFRWVCGRWRGVGAVVREMNMSDLFRIVPVWSKFLREVWISKMTSCGKDYKFAPAERFSFE